jgi:hypothetical protein
MLIEPNGATRFDSPASSLDVGAAAEGAHPDTARAYGPPEDPR